MRLRSALLGAALLAIFCATGLLLPSEKGRVGILDDELGPSHSIADTSPDWNLALNLTDTNEKIRSVSFSPDGSFLVSGSSDQYVRIYDTTTWNQVTSVGWKEVRSLKFSPDGTLLAGTGDESVALWLTSDWSAVRTLTEESYVTSIDFSPDGQLFVSGTAAHGGNIIVKSTAGWGEVYDEENPGGGYVASASFSQDSSRLAIGASDGYIRIFDTNNWTVVHSFVGHQDDVNELVFSPDGLHLVSGSIDDTIKVWNTTTWIEVPSLMGHGADISDLEFSSDGSLLASASNNGRVGIWDCSDWSKIQLLYGSNVSVYDVSFSPDGNKLAAGSYDGSVYVWSRPESTTSAVGEDSNEGSSISWIGSSISFLVVISLCGLLLAMGVNRAYAFVRLLTGDKNEDGEQRAQDLEEDDVGFDFLTEPLQSSPFTRIVGDDQIDVFNTGQIGTLPAEAYHDKWATVVTSKTGQHVLSVHPRKSEAVDALLAHEMKLKEILKNPLMNKDILAESGDLSPESEPITEQNLIEQRFTVGELIAEGGMAQVFRATEGATQQTVIWKQAYAKFSPITVSNQKLEDEVGLLQIVRHPRIPTYLAHGEIADKKGEGCVVLVQEFIEGGDLKVTVEQLKKVGVQMPLAKAIEYLIQISEPLEHMASLPSPVYHRDLKPHNIIVHPDRGPVLIDFGLAKMVETGSDVSVTRGGSGTWTPPERDSGVSGPFTDVWSLGKILYYLLTNEVPPAILDQDDIASKFAECERPEWLAQFVVWSCWPQHAKRIQSVQQFRILLDNEGKWPEGESIDSAASDSGDFTTWG